MRRLAIWCLVATAVFGLMFLVFKGFEYAEDIEKHLVPGASFALKEPAAQIFLRAVLDYDGDSRDPSHGWSWTRWTARHLPRLARYSACAKIRKSR